MAIPIINDWEKYFHDPHEGLGSSYERIILNELLLHIAADYAIETALESPSFGFTGVSGINLVALAKTGCQINLEDHEQARIEHIAALWQGLNLPLNTKLTTDYSNLDYPDNSFDLGFNFSALWFTENLSSFLSEFCRVCQKAILICVPNRDGIGYKMQIKDYNAEKYPSLHPQHIDPNSIKYLMRKNGWNLKSENYIDCPPWPDIGMSKELFFKRILKLSNESTESTGGFESTGGCQSSVSALWQTPAQTIVGADCVRPNPENSYHKGERNSPLQPHANTPTRQHANTPARPHALTILPYYRDQDPTFATKMLRYAFVERTAPRAFKRYWAHHYYMLFTSPTEQNK